ncbi:Uu.00g093290.m01.CDS01 [Anthostomella pinea]|uniref:Uu.00g093290.m01.CDS01 n=1 Tax=Anthostomella pinea TaxID=933095 RepID=A0AAI8VNI7_9PEZI|nr:Uu.00g093290.m01.CDS01 [Anthostomella pinea]
MADAQLLAEWFPDFEPKAPKMRGESVFYRNLEEQLDVRRNDRTLFTLRRNEPAPKSIDVSTLDFLGLTHSALLRQPFLDELASHPDFHLGAGGSRLLNGNNAYAELVEREIADFHVADEALLFHSGFEANVALMLAIPRPGDAIVFDELVHASMHEGMQGSVAPCKKSFKHNDVDKFREVLMEVRETQTLIKKGQRSVFIALESLYSMDGDVSPLRELVEVAKEIFPEGNAQFFVDEAHTTGVFGKQGRGYVDELGLHNEIAIRMHTFGKAMACTGAVVLCKSSVRDTLMNHARAFLYSTAPSFPMLAAIRAGYKLLKSGQTQPLQDHIQQLVKHFFRTLQENPVWDEASDEGILSIPTMEDFENRPFVTQVCPIVTRQRYTRYLCWHLQLAGYNCFPIDYPVVPRGMNRLRVVLHAHNTVAEVEGFAEAICEWAQEMLNIEERGNKGELPTAARRVIASQAELKANGRVRGEENGHVNGYENGAVNGNGVVNGH